MLLVLSSLFGVMGGIPSFNRLLLRAAAEYAAQSGTALRVVVLTDSVAKRPQTSKMESLFPELFEHSHVLRADWYRPCGGDRLRLALETLRALPNCRCIVFGHVNLAPLGLPSLIDQFGQFGTLPYCVIAHGLEVWTPLPWHRRLALRYARVVGCVSQDTARAVQEVQGVEKARCLRISNAVEKLPPAPGAVSMANPSGPLRIVSVTRLHPGEPKGIDLMLYAIADIPHAVASYEVVGDGAARPMLSALAQTLALQSRVHFTGALADAERDLALSRCDVFALPSTGEGFGIAYLEAMAYAKPCLAAQAGGAPEVVLHDETGIVVPPTVDAVRDALLRFCDVDLRARLGAAGRVRVSSQFTYPAFARQAFQLFDRLSDRHSDG